MELNVNQAIIHPNYNSTTQRNDIALIRLGKSAVLGMNVRPACLPDPDKGEEVIIYIPDSKSCAREYKIQDFAFWNSL